MGHSCNNEWAARDPGEKVYIPKKSGASKEEGLSNESFSTLNLIGFSTDLREFCASLSSRSIGVYWRTLLATLLSVLPSESKEVRGLASRFFYVGHATHYMWGVNPPYVPLLLRTNPCYFI